MTWATVSAGVGRSTLTVTWVTVSAGVRRSTLTVTWVTVSFVRSGCGVGCELRAPLVNSLIEFLSRV